MGELTRDKEKHTSHLQRAQRISFEVSFPQLLPFSPEQHQLCLPADFLNALYTVCVHSVSPRSNGLNNGLLPQGDKEGDDASDERSDDEDKGHLGQAGGLLPPRSRSPRNPLLAPLGTRVPFC